MSGGAGGLSETYCTVHVAVSGFTKVRDVLSLQSCRAGSGAWKAIHAGNRSILVVHGILAKQRG